MRTSVEGASLYYVIRGEGEPVLLVHGFPLSHRMWLPSLERLGPGYRAIVPDLRGHGASEPGEGASMARYADDLVAVLDASGETAPVVVVGLSMGGYVALELVRRHPERVSALVLVDTRAGADSPDAARARLQAAERAMREGSAAVTDPMVEKLFSPATGEAVRSEWRQLMADTPPQGIAAAQRAMAARPDSFDTLRTLACPLLLVVGEDDAITPPEEARRMQQAAPHARLEIVPAAGHLTPLEQPERFAALLRDFIS